jgi:protocatechuate 3,4-dioxygenase beta subunit
MPGRRDVLKGLGAGVGLAGASIAGLIYRADAMTQPLRYALGEPGPDVGSALEPTLQCEAGRLTTAQTEGPFYTPKTPGRRDIRDALHAGLSLVVAGRVLDTHCRPVPGVVLDFWQTDHTGRYDNHGYRYRGHQRTDADGRFELVTVRPVKYQALGVWRTPHIHVKAQGAKTRMLTTQLYLPDEQESNSRDFIFHESLLMTMLEGDGSAQRARFDFVLADA